MRESSRCDGIGLVSTPLPIPNLPLFGYVAGLIAATTYYVQATWVSAQGQESAPSPITTYTTVDGSLLTVELSDPAAGATGWNVYIGLDAWPLSLQNSAPVGIGSMFTLAAEGLFAGASPGTGQSPDYYVTGGRMLRRG